jgi:hypothetical protein
LVSVSSASSSGGAVDLVVEVAGDASALLLLRLQRGGAGAPALGFEPPHHPQEGELDPLHLLGLADAVDRARQQRAGAAEVDLLHLLDQSLQRGAAAAHDQQAGGEAGHGRQEHDDHRDCHRGATDRIEQA